MPKENEATISASLRCFSTPTFPIGIAGMLKQAPNAAPSFFDKDEAW